MPYKYLIIFSALLFSLYSCKEEPDIEWNFTKAEITGDKHVNTEKLNVDIYLDVTTSMKGFVSQEATDYSRLLEDIEAICQNVWKNNDIKFFKFGRTLVPISRNEFVSGKTSAAIFSDPQLSTQTNFAEAIKNTNAKRVSILITDFFYNNNDVNLVVNAVKTYGFQKGVEVGVIGLNSNFKGIVGDVQPPVSVNGPRPLYVLVFGDKQNITLFFNTFKNKNYIKPNQLLLITNKPTENFEVVVTKDRKSKTINKQSMKEAWKKQGTIYNFRMREKENQAEFNLELTLQTNPYTAGFTGKNLKTLVFKKSANAKDSIAADDELLVQDLKLAKNKINATLKLINNDKAGKYAYLVYLTFDNTVSPAMPNWVKELNTETFAQGINQNKTLNLEKLLTNISINHITYSQPKLAKFYINIEKE